MEPIYFTDTSTFRKWLEANHETETEVLVSYYKVATGKPSITWLESVDQALCFGWIDGVRRSIDMERYCIRFTPRRPGSNWSAVNIKKVEDLKRQGLMQKAGLEIFRKRKESTSEIYRYENKPEKFSDEYEKKFKEGVNAWTFFSSQSPSYQKTATYWVLSAKQESTKLRRFEKLIEACETGKRLF